MPAAASSTARPSFTNANGEHEHAGHCEEQCRVQNLPALHFDRDVLAQHERARCGRTFTPIPQPSAAVARAQAGFEAGSSATKRPVAQCSATRVDEPIGQIEIVRGEHARSPRRRPAHDSRSETTRTERIVEPGERLVEQHEPRPMQQRALEREPLPHPARETRHVVVGAVGEPGALERGIDGAPRGQTVQSSEERQVLTRRQLGYRCSSCASRPMRLTQRRSPARERCGRRSGPRPWSARQASPELR